MRNNGECGDVPHPHWIHCVHLRGERILQKKWSEDLHAIFRTGLT